MWSCRPINLFKFKQWKLFCWINIDKPIRGPQVQAIAFLFLSDNLLYTYTTRNTIEAEAKQKRYGTEERTKLSLMSRFFLRDVTYPWGKLFEWSGSKQPYKPKIDEDDDDYSFDFALYNDVLDILVTIIWWMYMWILCVMMYIFVIYMIFVWFLWHVNISMIMCNIIIFLVNKK